MQTILNKDIATIFGSKPLTFLSRPTPTSVELQIETTKPGVGDPATELVIVELGTDVVLDDTVLIRVVMLLGPARFPDDSVGDEHSFSAVVSDEGDLWAIAPKELPRKD